MILKNIQFDLPYREDETNIRRIMVHENCSYEDAYKIDYDLNWRFKRRFRFEEESRCIVAMFFRLLRRYDNKDCKKIVISCTEKNTRTDFGPVIGICVVNYALKSADDFLNMDDKSKKECFFNILKESITTLAKAKDWDLTQLEKTLDQIEKSQFNNYWTYGKRKRSPNKLYTAELYIEHEVTELRFFILIRNNDGDIIKQKLIYKEEPREWYYTKHCGVLTWLSDAVVSINDKVWTVF